MRLMQIVFLYYMVAIFQPSLVFAQSFSDAQATYARLSTPQRYTVAFDLMVTGQFVGIADGKMGPRLFEAIKRFQAENGILPDGLATPRLVAVIASKSQPITAGWGLRMVTHPSSGAKMLAPFGYTPIQTPTKRGLSLERPDKLMSIDFSFFPAEEIPLHALYQRIGTPGSNRQVGYKILRERFFVVTGKTGERGFYSRYDATAGGSVGFTVSWLDAALHGDRLSTLMSNSLSTKEALATNAGPGSVPPSAQTLVVPPPQLPQVAVTAPPSPPAIKQEPKAAEISTGSGFFVSSDGNVLTNSHVVSGCNDALIMDHGIARVVARDARNDLALLKLKAINAEKKPAVIKFRSGAVQLGEVTFVLGYPLAGRLDNGLNFTNGMVSAVSGIDNDTSNFQMTAPIQSGNSGGPIVDKSGNLIGVVVATLKQSANSRAVTQNVNFGIKADTAATFLRSNGVEPSITTEAVIVEPTAIASEGRKQTVQVVCFPN